MMVHFVGLDVSVKETSVCVVDETGQVVAEHRVATEPDEIAKLLTSLGVEHGRVSLEAGRSHSGWSTAWPRRACRGSASRRGT
jgi:hypothetical protein